MHRRRQLPRACIRAAFQGAKIMKDENVLDNQTLITYLSDTLWGIAP